MSQLQLERSLVTVAWTLPMCEYHCSAEIVSAVRVGSCSERACGSCSKRLRKQRPRCSKGLAYFIVSNNAMDVYRALSI
eukprot:5462229-Amphidinium_carterae.1